MIDYLIEPPYDKWARIDQDLEYAEKQYSNARSLLEDLADLIQEGDMQKDQILEYANKMKLALEEALSVYE